MIERLLAGQRAVRACADAVRALLVRDAGDAAALADARWQLGVTLLHHMAFEDRHLAAQVAHDPCPALAAAVGEYRERFHRHVADYADHAKYWSPDRTAQDRGGYRVATIRQLDRLDREMRIVERDVYPLLRDALPLAPASADWARAAFVIRDSTQPA